MKTTLSAALVFGQGALRERLLALRDRLATHATEGTRHFGEVMLVRPGPGGAPTPDQRVSTPHLWEGALFYLTAIALETPEAFLRYDERLPPSRVGAPEPDAAPADAGEIGEPDAAPPGAGERSPGQRPGAGGCDCDLGGSGTPPLALLLLIALRRRRHP